MNEKKGVIIAFFSFLVIVMVSFLAVGEHTTGVIPGETNITANGTGGETSISAVPVNSEVNLTFFINNTGPSDIMYINITLPSGVTLVNDTSGQTNYTGSDDDNANWTFYEDEGTGTITWAHGNVTVGGGGGSDGEAGNFSNGLQAILSATFTLSGVESDTDFNFTILTYDNDTGETTTGLTLTVATPSAPVISDINITDIAGNTITAVDGTGVLQYNESFNLSFTLNHTLYINDTNVTVYFNYSGEGYSSAEARDISIGEHEYNATTTDIAPPYRFNVTVLAPDLHLHNTSSFLSMVIVAHVTDAYNVSDWELVTGSYNLSVDQKGTSGNVTNLNVTVGGKTINNTGNWEGGEFVHGNQPIHITFEVDDPDVNHENVSLIFNVSNHFENQSELLNVATDLIVMTNSTSGDANGPVQFNATLPKGIFNDTNLVSFLIVAPSLFYQSNSTTIYETVSGPHNFTVNDTDVSPTISNVNVTDFAGNTISNLTGNDKFLRADGDGTGSLGYNLSIEFDEITTNYTNVTIVFNWSNTTPGDDTDNKNFPIGEGARAILEALGGLDVEYNTSTTDTGSSGRYRLNVTVPVPVGVSNDTVKMSFVVIAQSNLYNVSDYELISTTYNFTLDGTSPSATLIEPASTSINLEETIRYTCNGGDASGATCNTEIKDPNGEVVVVKSGCGTDHPYNGVETSVTGTYAVTCSVTDGVGLTATSTGTFDVTSTTTNNNPNSGRTSSDDDDDTTADEPAPTFDIDFTEVSKGTVETDVGGTRTFTFEGNVQHSLKVDAIEGNSATITISSEPQTITLNVGESQDIDYNADGQMDIRVTLDQIKSGISAVFTIETLAGAGDLAAEEAAEVAAAQQAADDAAADAADDDGEGGFPLVWVIVGIVVVALALLGVFFGTKKK